MSDNPTCPQFPARPPHGGEPFIVPPAPRRRPGLPVLSVNGHAPDGHGDLALTYIDGAEYAAGYGDPPGPALLFRQGGDVVAVVDATPLLKDGMVSSVAVSGGNLVVTFNTDAGKEPVEIPLTDIFDPDDFALIGDIAPDWTATAAVGTVFAANQLCSYGGRIYRCKLGYTFNGENPPSSDATHWEPTTVEDVLAAKQDAIGDLAAIRSGAAAGATAYQKPAGGIAASDLAAAVQTSLGKADTALQAQDITGKADMVANATHGHFAALTSTGNLVDSGKAAGDFLPKTGGTVNGDLEVAYTNAGFTVKDASGNYLRIQHGVVAGDFWYVDYSVANVGNGSLRLPYDNIIPADVLSLAGYFNGSTTYTHNSLCVDPKYGRLYRCVNPNGHTGAWVAADFAVATVEDVLAALRTAVAGKQDALSAAQLANIAAVPNKADVSALRYDLPTNATAINTASQETIEGETVNYGEATLADRTGNRVSITAALDELRVAFPPAVSGKLRDFGLRVEVGTGSAALTAPALVPVAQTGETLKLENNAKQIPALADGAAAAKGVTLIYFSESAPGVFFAKSEQVGEVA